MAEIRIEHLDRNLAVSSAINAPDLRLYDVRKPPFEIYGLYRPTEEPVFKRMPSEIAATVNEGVKRLHLHTAGGRVRFSTDSPYIAIKAVMPKVAHMSHMPLTGSSGFDLYIDSADGEYSVFHRTFVPPFDMKDGYESKVDIKQRGLHYYTINFPLYNEVSELYIGVAEGSILGAGAPYKDLPPVVYYGSSITQGGCASRPGNAYQAIVSRDLSIDHVNLGFSGNGLAEDTMVDYLKGLRMSAFVSDYDHNAPNEKHLEATHRKMYEAIREAQPDLPYIMLTRPDFYHHNVFIGGENSSARRRRVIIDTYHYALDRGDRKVFLIDGESLFRGIHEDSCTVDGTHPNDLGFSRMADAVESILRRILREGKMQK